MNLIDSHASLQSSHSCKLNTVAWVVELMYLHIVVKCESLLGGHGKARCTVRLVRPKFEDNYEHVLLEMASISAEYFDLSHN